MASTSASTSTSRRSPSPPPAPRLSGPSSPPLDLAQSPSSPPLRREGCPLRDPAAPPESCTTIKISTKKRRRVLKEKDPTLLHGSDLQPHVKEILESSGLESLREAMEDMEGNKTMLNSFAYHYPNAFSLKLAKLLELHPPPDVRHTSVAFLHQTLIERHGSDSQKIYPAIIDAMKKPILDSYMLETQECLLSPFCGIINDFATRVYVRSEGGWEELLEYVCSCVFSDVEFSNRKGLGMLAELPLETVEDEEFWARGNYDKLFSSIVEFSESPNQQLEALTFDASITLFEMSISLGRLDVGSCLVPIILRFIDRHAEKELVLNGIRKLADLVSLEEELAELFKGKEGDVFRCMLRLAAKRDTSEEVRMEMVFFVRELDMVSLKAVSQLVESLSESEVRRVLEVSMDMMLCVEDQEAVWYDVDHKDAKHAGVSKPFRCAEYLMDLICAEGNPSVFAPIAIQMIKTYLADNDDLQKHHAGLFTLATFAEAQKEYVIQHFQELETLVFASMNDQQHPRTLWAAIYAVSCLSGCIELLPENQYHIKFLAKLVSIINTVPFPLVQVHAIKTLSTLLSSCPLDRLSSLGEDIIISMLTLMKHEKPRLQVHAVETINSVAVTIPVIFQQYYNTTKESLKDILFHNHDDSSPKLLLRAKCLECMSNIVKLEQNKFQEQEALQVMQSLISVEQKLSSTDYVIRNHILKAVDQFYRFHGAKFDGCIHRVIQIVLRSAEDNDLKTKSLDENCKMEAERNLACINILSNLAVRSPVMFCSYIAQVCLIFGRWIVSSCLETQKASITALPNLLRSMTLGVQDVPNKIAISNKYVQCLIQALGKGYSDDDMFPLKLRSLFQCIQISGPVLDPERLKEIVDEINQMLNKIIGAELDKEAGNSEGQSENEAAEKLIQGTYRLMTVAIETFQARFLPHVDDLISNVSLLWVENFSDKLKAMGFSTFNLIVQQFPQKMQKYHDAFVSVVIKAIRQENPPALHLVRLEAARGIGLCAMYGGQNFRAIADEAVSSLFSVITNADSTSSGNKTRIYDVAVAALGKICVFHRETFVGLQLTLSWLNFLPLTTDLNEARYAHTQLSKMLRRSDAELLGPNNENLPKIISVVREILSRNDEYIATEETILEMVQFLDRHGAMP